MVSVLKFKCFLKVKIDLKNIFGAKIHFSFSQKKCVNKNHDLARKLENDQCLEGMLTYHIFGANIQRFLHLFSFSMSDSKR